MFKRKLSHDFDGGPHVRIASVFDGDPTPMTSKRKRLFRPKNNSKHLWTPEAERSMSELLDFILQHEEAFKKYARSARDRHELTLSVNTALHRSLQTFDNNSIQTQKATMQT